MGASKAAGARAQRRRAEIDRRKAERRAAAQAEPRVRTRPDPRLLLPALAGTVLAGYLAGVAWWGATPVACGEGSGCDAVQSSRFASVLGIPVAAWGAASYAALAGIAWGVRSRRWRGHLALAISGPALAVSLYLTAISLFVLHATCLWCLASLGLMGACFVAAIGAQPAGLRKVAPRLAAVTAVSLLTAGTLHLHFRGVFDPAAGPEDPHLRALAQHLADSGATFYGASWCPHCEEQKALFGSSAHRLPYVECSPDGRSAPPARACRSASVDAYPTWIVDGQRVEGLLPPARLAQLSGFEAGAGS